MESRNCGTQARRGNPKSSPLPIDFLKLACEVFTANFDPGLKALGQLRPGPRFEARGAVFADEVVLAISLVHGTEIAATTCYASVDFDPRATAPSIQDLVGACVDAVGAVFAEVLDPAKPARIAQVAAQSLSALDEIPFEWTPIAVGKLQIHVKLDKSNPSLESMADDWLRENDPEAKMREEEEKAQAEGRFIVGPSVSGKKPLKQ